MPMHAVLINSSTVDFIAQVNGGVEPLADDNAVFVHGDRIDDPWPGEIITRSEFVDTYTFCNSCDDENCNLVFKK